MFWYQSSIDKINAWVQNWVLSSSHQKGFITSGPDLWLPMFRKFPPWKNITLLFRGIQYIHKCWSLLRWCNLNKWIMCHGISFLILYKFLITGAGHILIDQLILSSTVIFKPIFRKNIAAVVFSPYLFLSTCSQESALKQFRYKNWKPPSLAVRKGSHVWVFPINYKKQNRRKSLSTNRIMSKPTNTAVIEGIKNI